MFQHLKGHHQAKVLVIKHKKDTRSLFPCPHHEPIHRE